MLQGDPDDAVLTYSKVSERRLAVTLAAVPLPQTGKKGKKSVDTLLVSPYSSIEPTFSHAAHKVPSTTTPSNNATSIALGTQDEHYETLSRLYDSGAFREPGTSVFP